MDPRKIILVVEVFITLILWGRILVIPNLEYDLNYAVLIYGFLFSIICFGAFYAYWRIYTVGKKWRDTELIIYSIFNSPITFIMAALSQGFQS